MVTVVRFIAGVWRTVDFCLAARPCLNKSYDIIIAPHSICLLSVKHRQQSRSPAGRVICGHFIPKYDLILEFCQNHSFGTRRFPMGMASFLFHFRLRNWNVNLKTCYILSVLQQIRLEKGRNICVRIYKFLDCYEGHIKILYKTQCDLRFLLLDFEAPSGFSFTQTIERNKIVQLTQRLNESEIECYDYSRILYSLF